MKKSLTVIAVSLFALMFFTGSAIAIDGADITSTNNTIGTAAGGRPALESVNVSPNVTMGYYIDPDAFAINSVNSKGVIEYGVSSDSSNIFFKSVDSGSTPTALEAADSATAFPAADYATLGGS